MDDLDRRAIDSLVSEYCRGLLTEEEFTAETIEWHTEVVRKEKQHASQA